jgi:preprotein translocase subunit YajC
MLFIADAYAQSGANPSEPSWTPLLVMAIMMVVLFFVTIRPQAKRQKELKAMVDALSKGDEVVTNGGMVGKVAEITDQYITLQIGTAGDRPVTVVVQRGAVQTLLPKGTIKSI